MLVSHRYKFIYLKTVKTASTSIEAYFEPFCLDQVTCGIPCHHTDMIEGPAGVVGFRGSIKADNKPKFYHHMPAAEIKEKLGDSIWDNYFKFCVIRNPFEKAISWYHFQKTLVPNRSQGLGRALKNRIKNFYISHVAGLSEEEKFRRLVRMGHFVKDRPIYTLNEQPICDFYIRYEHLEKDIQEVSRLLGIGFAPDRIPSFKSGIRSGGHPNDYFDQETVKLVADYYHWELEHFHYSPPVSSS